MHNNTEKTHKPHKRKVFILSAHALANAPRNANAPCFVTFVPHTHPPAPFEVLSKPCTVPLII